MSILWLAGVAAFIILEAFTYQLICIWFALGCIAAMIAASFDVGTMAQMWIFVGVSAVALICTRPLVKKLIKSKPSEKTNADRIIGSKAVVIKKIDGVDAIGQVKSGGSVWTAKSCDGGAVDEGETVVVKSIEGVKLMVERV